MSDKFRTTFVVPVSFAQGEQPTATKLNAVSTQARNGLAVLERAIGDMWNQSGDPVTAAYPNRVTNLARALGDQALLNSKLPLPDFTGTTSVRIRQPIAPHLGKSEIILDFKPENDSILTASVQLLINNASASYTGPSVNTRDLVDTDTEWFVDTTKGTVHLGRALHITQTTQYIEYTVLAANFPSDSVNSSGFSVIPNQTQLDWKGLKISSISANKYFLTLPFRRPEATPLGLSKIPAVTNNEAVIGTPGTIRYFGPTTAGYAFTAGISNARFYRYSLPEVAMGMFIAPTAGTTIPSGTLYLWDTVTNTIIDGVTFRIPDAPMALFAAQVPWVIQAEGATLDQVFSGFASSASSETAADYTLGARFALIGVGSSIAEAISQLRKELTEGDAALGPRRRPSHRDLTETQPAQGGRHATNFPPSFVDGDGHPHLLSRLGSRASATVAEHRDRFNNGILGDLLLLSTDPATNYQNLSAPSNYIYFGSHSGNSPRLRVSPLALTLAPTGVSQHSLEIDNTSPVINTGLIKMGNGYIRHISNSDIGLFDSAGDAAGNLWTRSLRLNGTTQTLSTFTGSLNSVRYIDINAWAANDFNFLGGNLTIGSSNANVVIGGSSYLRLYNNRLTFGTSDTDPPRIVYSSNRFTLYRNTVSDRADFSCDDILADDITCSNVYTNVLYANQIDVDDISVADTIEFLGIATINFNTGFGIGGAFEFRSNGSLESSHLRTGQVHLEENLGISDPASNVLVQTNTPKAWGCIRIAATGSTPLITTQNGFNIMSVVVSPTHPTTRFRVTFASGMSNANYCVTMTTMPSEVENSLYEMLPTFGYGYKEANYFEFGRFNRAGGANLNVQGTYLIEVSFSVFATQI